MAKDTSGMSQFMSSSSAIREPHVHGHKKGSILFFMMRAHRVVRQLLVTTPRLTCLKALGSTALLCTLLCACQSTRPPPSHQPKDASALQTSHTQRLHLEGRLFIEVGSLGSPSSNPKTPSSSKRINAAFELDTQDDRGELRLLGPLGTTSALISWSEDQAQLQSPELTPPVQFYPNLSLLAQHWLGADLPLPHILHWLEGHEQNIDGWQFSQTGKLIKTVQRTSPMGNAPHVSLKLILNEPAR